jgi:hypothetical protein
MESPPNRTQFIWGIALIIAGIGVFLYIIPQRLPEIIEYRKVQPSDFELYFMYFCFGLIGIILFVGGAKKIHHYMRGKEKTNGE